MPKPYRLDLAFTCQRVQARFMAPGETPPATDKVRFTGVAYSGGVIPAYGWLGDVAIDLATLQNPDAQNIPVLVDHSAEIENIAGKGNLTRVGNALHITGELTQATDAGRQIAALMLEGFPLQLSVGMQANLRETSEPQSQQINGQALIVKAVFEQARILEVSFVPTGADPHTSAAQFSAKALEPVPQPATMKGVVMTRTPEDQALIDSLQALCQGRSLTAKEKTIHNQCLMGVLRELHDELHDELDTAVRTAYGLPGVSAPHRAKAGAIATSK